MKKPALVFEICIKIFDSFTILHPRSHLMITNSYTFSFSYTVNICIYIFFDECISFNIIVPNIFPYSKEIFN